MTFTLAGYQSARITAALERIGSALSDGKGAAAVNAATVTEAGTEVILENILFGIWLGGVAVVLLFLAAAAQEDCSGSEAGRGRL